MTAATVHAALAAVDDPEYPGISIVDLGLVESVSVDEDGHAHIGLIPTFSGCPALAMIAADVERSVAAAPDIRSATVEWLRSPSWTVDRVSGTARTLLSEEFTVAVELSSGSARCPMCGSSTHETSMFGPSRCRAIHACSSCSETVEVLRG